MVDGVGTAVGGTAVGDGTAVGGVASPPAVGVGTLVADGTGGAGVDVGPSVGVATGAAMHATASPAPPPVMSSNAFLRFVVCGLMLLTGCTPAAPAVPSATSVPPAAAPATAIPPPTAMPTSVPTAHPTPTVGGLADPPPTATTAPTVAPTPTPGPRPALSDAISETIAQHAGSIGVVVSRLDGSQSFDFNGDRRFRAASLYKLFILATAMAAIDSGSLDAQDVLTISPALVAADPFADFLTGTRVSVDCALRTMVEMSGNSAADVLEERLGIAAINAQMRALGLRQSSLTADAAVTTPRDMALLLSAIGRGEAFSPSASQRMLALLSNQEQNDRIPVPLPLTMRVAHKTGELPGLRHDVAIVFAPSGPYVLAALVQDAPDEAAARSTIVDLSRAAYAALEPSDPPLYLGLPPRLARDVFRLADSQQRMAILADPRTETVRLDQSEIDLADGSTARLRPEAVPDLIALQRAARAAGAAFSVRSGFLRPTQAEAAKAVPVAWLEPCPVAQPTRTADLRVRDEAPTGLQHWLGTVVTLSDSPPSVAWLVQHAWEYGFVPSLPEASDSDQPEPSTWRWVGRPMAARVRPAIGAPDYASRLRAELGHALSELAEPERLIWGQSTQCWTIATASGQGCAARWYFLPLQGFQDG